LSLKKLLGIISVVIIVMFSFMFTASYAWYAFENAGTTFSAVTNNDDINISYQSGEYISTSIAIPISSDQIEKYAEKNIFNIGVKDSANDNEIVVTISLSDINISGSLQRDTFKVALYYQGSNIATVGGNLLTSSSRILGTVTLDNDMTNNFELRVYILDDGTNQTVMMNKSFQAKIKIDAVSRLKTDFNDYNAPDINISGITIDGEDSNNLPISGYYNMSSSCEKGSNLTWEPLSKTITYNSGSYVNDSCSLTFTSSTSTQLLNTKSVGSYVKYVGANGCDGKACEGQNANYSTDLSMGYCNDANYKFNKNGWRIAYIENGSAYLISAGAPECMCSNSDGTISNSSCSTSLTSENMSKHYANLFASALKYCNSTYSKDGLCDSTTVSVMSSSVFQKVVGTALSSSSCYNQYSNMGCGYNNSLIDNGGFYWFSSDQNSSVFSWDPSKRYVGSNNSDVLLGVRPIIALDEAVLVVGGIGTYEDPYIIDIG